MPGVHKLNLIETAPLCRLGTMVFVHILLTQFPFLQFNYHRCLARHTTFRPLYSGGPSILFFDGIGAVARCSSKRSYAWTPSSIAARSSSLSLISWVRRNRFALPPSICDMQAWRFIEISSFTCFKQFMLENEQDQVEEGVIKLSPVRLDVRCDE